MDGKDFCPLLPPHVVFLRATPIALPVSIILAAFSPVKRRNRHLPPPGVDACLPLVGTFGVRDYMAILLQRKRNEKAQAGRQRSFFDLTTASAEAG